MRKLWVFATAVIFSVSPSLRGQAISNSPQGFQQQYQRAWTAGRTGINDKAEELMGEFALPDGWFDVTFGPDVGPGLKQQYNGEFAQFKRQMLFVGLLNLLVKRGLPSESEGKYLTVETKLEDKQSPLPSAHAPPQSSLPLPAALEFETQVIRPASKQPRMMVSSWANLYVYVDGRFRFAGRGAYPFWNPPNIRRPDRAPSPEMCREVSC